MLQRDFFIKFADQCLQIINNEEIFNRLKGSTKIQKRESSFKHQSRIYNVKINSDINHIGIKMI